jgi:peptidoglycan/xylan/chitin deacetylase (PgdA/CDA1 family)
MKAINLEWTPVSDAAAYRLTFRESGSGDLVTRSEPFSEPRYTLDPSLTDGREVYARLEIRRNGEDEDEDAWEDAGPTASIPVPPPDEDVTVLSWDGVSPVHRLVISDQTTGNKVVDEPVLGTSYAYAPDPAVQGHDLVWRVRAWQDGDWDEGTEWQTLPLRVMMGEPRDPPSPLAADPEAGLLLVFSIDTEGFLARQRDPNPATAVDELIFGDFGESKGGGIGLHMDLLEHFGYRGSFFVDVLSAYQYGEDELKRAVEAIMERGHEVQLHVHDEHLRNSDDPAIRALAGDLMQKDYEEFRDILGLGIEVFERLTGKQPIAYRAGGYRITDEHFPALQELGIKIDTSMNAYLNSRVSKWMKTRTQPYWVGDVLELPPTWTLVRDDREAQETRAFAPNATAGDPVSSMPSGTGIPRVATYVSHSSELMYSDRGLSGDALASWERNARDRLPDEIAEKAIQEVTANPRLVNGTVDEELLYRMAGLLRRIADRDDARCVTFAELSEVTDRFPRDRRNEPVDPVPAIDRPHGAATVTGTRIYSDALLTELAGPGPANGRGGQIDDDAVTMLVNADTAWKGGKIAVIGDQSAAVSEWLERREVAEVEHLEEPDPKSSGAFDVVAWPSGFERCTPGELGDRLDDAAAMLSEDGTLVLRLRTLGVGPTANGSEGPPLSELVFPAAAQRSTEVTAWDATTFSAWFEARGFGVVAQRGVARTSGELKALDRFADKLAAIPDQDLQTAAVDFTLRRAPEPEAAEPGPASPEATGADLLSRFALVVAGDDVLEIKPSEEGVTEIPLDDVTVTTATPGTVAEGSLEPDSSDVIVCPLTFEGLEPERLADAALTVYRALRPGGQLLLAVSADGTGIATGTTILVSLLRAGLEVVATESSGEIQYFHLLRPLELPDIVRFSGISA